MSKKSLIAFGLGLCTVVLVAACASGMSNTADNDKRAPSTMPMGGGGGGGY
jgi:hypothetical protein